MFSIPHLHFKEVNGYREHKEKLLNFFDACPHKKSSKYGKDDIVTDWYYGQEEFTHPQYYSYVCKILEPEINRINEAFGNHDIEVRDIWFQQSINYKRHYVHTHGAVGISCIWYLEFDPSEHSSTKFYAPFTDPLTGNCMEYEPEVQEGDLIAFPSYLHHEQKPSFSDKRRTVISFNITRKIRCKELGEQITDL